MISLAEHTYTNQNHFRFLAAANKYMETTRMKDPEMLVPYDTPYGQQYERQVAVIAKQMCLEYTRHIHVYTSEAPNE